MNKLKRKFKLKPFLFIRDTNEVYEQPDGEYDVYRLCKRIIRAAANDGIHNGDDIATKFTSRRAEMKKIMDRFKDNLMEFFDEYDFDVIIADALVLCAVLLSFAFGIYFILENYGGL